MGPEYWIRSSTCASHAFSKVSVGCSLGKAQAHAYARVARGALHALQRSALTTTTGDTRTQKG